MMLKKTKIGVRRGKGIKVVFSDYFAAVSKSLSTKI